eukprot:277127_1
MINDNMCIIIFTRWQRYDIHTIRTFIALFLLCSLSHVIKRCCFTDAKTSITVETMGAWIVTSLLVLIHFCDANVIATDHDQLIDLTRRALVRSRAQRTGNPYNEQDHVDDTFAARNSFTAYDNQIYDDDEDIEADFQELEANIESFIDGLSSLNTEDLKYYLAMIEDEDQTVAAHSKPQATTFHVLFTRHPYTLQNQHLYNSFRFDIAAADPIGRYQLEALRDNFLEAVKKSVDSSVYDMLTKGKYRLDVSPLRRAVLTGLMMQQSLYDKTKQSPGYGYVMDRRLQEYHPLACRHSKQPQCKVNRVQKSTLEILSMLYEKGSMTSINDISKVKTWLKEGFREGSTKSPDVVRYTHDIKRNVVELNGADMGRSLHNVIPDALVGYLSALAQGKVDISSMFEKGKVRDTMSAETSKALVADWVQHIGDAHGLGSSEEPVVVVGGHSEWLKDLMKGGTNVVITPSARKAYDEARCPGAHKICNCQLVYFKVDLSGKPTINTFKHVWRPSEVTDDYVEAKGWKVGSKGAKGLKTA